MTTPTSTNLPLCGALATALRAIVLTSATPAINADISALMTAQGISSGHIPTFGEKTVRVGDVDPVMEPTICIFAGIHAKHYPHGDETYNSFFWSNITLKVPAVGDNAPEDFMLLGNSFRDNLRDALSSPSSTTLTPVNKSGKNILPQGMQFVDCMIVSEAGPVPVRGINATSYYRKWEFSHVCNITYPVNRPQPLG